jgi:hypothetical protein
VRSIQVAAIGGLLLVGMAGWWWTGPERQIRRVLAEVAEAIGEEAAPRDGAGIGAAAALHRHLAADVVVEPGPPFDALVGREAVLALAIRVRRSSGVARVRFEDVRVTILPGGRAADVSATAIATSAGPAGDRPTDARELAMTMTLTDRRWVITSARAVPVMEPL